MSSKARACKVDFDFKIYNRTGDKIPITRSSTKMAQTPLDEKKVLELQIFDDIKYIYKHQQTTKGTECGCTTSGKEKKKTLDFKYHQRFALVED